MDKFYKNFRLPVLFSILLLCNSILKGQVSSYNFTQTTGTYTALGVGATTAFTATDDDKTANLTIPFTFTYSGTGYTSCRITTNGFLTLGSNPSVTDYNPISGTAAATSTAISGFARDLNSTLKYQTLGTSPNRIFVAEWSSAYRYSVGSSENLNFQIRLYETTNIVEIQYGSMATPNTSFASGTAEVGLKSASNVYNNVTFTNATLSGYPYTNNWNSLVSGALQADVVGLTSSIAPASGGTLRWTPSSCTQVTTAASVSSVTNTSALVSWTNNALYASGYKVRWRKVDETYSAPTWTTPVSVAAGSSSYTITGLTASTYYVFSVEGLCSGSSANNYSTVTTANTINGKGLFMTSCVNASLPYPQGFNSTTFPTCWTQQYVTGTSNIQFVPNSTNPTILTPQDGADYVYWNSYSITSGNQTRLVSAPITTTGSTTVNARFYWYHDNSAYTGATYADEGVVLQYSLNGSVWNPVQTINRLLTGTDGWTLYDVALPAGAGNVATMYVGFLFTSRAGDNCALDNLLVYAPLPCNAPTDQPAALSLTAVTSTSLSGSFTAASPAPTGYIVLRSTSSTAPVLVNGATYNVGSSYSLPGSSYTVISYGPATTFTQTGLNPNTQYYYYALSYNGSCIGQPYFLNTSPLTANTLTCTAASATLTGATASSTSATINFSAITGAASYILQYSVAGANAWITASPAPIASPYTLNGLTPGTSYDIKIEGPNSNCGTIKTTTSAFTTACASISSLPWSEKFDGMATIGSGIVPPCWLHVAGTKSFYSSNASYTSYHDPASGINYVTIAYGNTTASLLWTPGFQLTAGVSYDFSFKWVGDGLSGWTGDALYNTSQSVAGATNLGSFVAAATTTSTSYIIKTYTFVPSATGTYYFATRVSANSTPWYLGFDDYSLKATPPCNYAGTASAAANSICGGSGSTTLSAVDYSLAGAGLAYNWQVSTDNVTFTDIAGATNPASASTGTISATRYYRLRVYCTSLGNSYSNVLTVTVGSYNITGTTGASRCGVGTVALNATATVGSTISWYDAPTGGTSLGNGSSFTTPEISTTTTYYVGANNGVIPATIGATYSGSGTNGTNVGSHGIVIATTSPNIVIVSAKIPFTGKGIFTIELQTTAGVVVSSVTSAEITGGGSVPVTVPLNISVTTPGTYRLLITGITGTIDDLGYISNAVYPYTGLGGAFSVTSGYWYGNDSFDNMYLFSLQVTNICESARISVTATVTAPPALTISPNAATICSGSSTTINVTTPGSNFNTYTWSPATGATAGGSPSGMTVTLNPTTTINYTLTATSASNCVNKATALITVNAAPPTTTGAAVCSGTNATIAAVTSCTNYGNPALTINGSWNATTDPTAPRPIIYIANSPTCTFDPAVIRNYTTQDFQVTVTGTYTFGMPNTTAYDGMGYIVTGAFVPGTCPGTGTWIVGDDDSGPTLFEPFMSATLTAGITYTLITTTYAASSGTVTDTYTWNITGPVGGAVTTVSGGVLQWYTVASGGSSISSASPFNPVGVAGSGVASNTSVGSYTFYAACSNNPTCRTATGYVIGAAGQWIGASNTAWSNVANWCGGVPIISTDATISLGAPNMPLLNAGTGAVRNLAVNTGASLTISNATMQIAGTITANNTITASAGTIELAGSTAQAISGSSFTNRTINNLIASNSVNVSAAVNDSMKITGTLSFGNVNSKVFSSGDNVILVSNATGTARVADITNNGVNSSNTFSGKFVVQRYIPARRAWRLMTAPITTGAQTINQAWQEAVGGNWALNPKPGYGTHVTGGAARNTTQGFDQGPNNASIYGHTGAAWNYLPLTTSEAVTNREGWMLFVRGSRAINLPLSNTGTVADITTLRPTGAIKFGTQPTITNTGFTVIGNPYASPINFKTINKSGVIGGVGGNAYYLWDPNLGGSNGVGAFVTFSYNSSGTYDKSIVTGTGTSNITNTGVIP
ncbi:MAG: fibronectin type III domain-containing protein [Chitinophagaceae bacterium]|nr:fibronectin type III domain-containing protein [Chitinophagaceae bacterium]